MTSYTLGGTVTGLGAGAAVTLANGRETLVVGQNGAFKLATRIHAGASYDITATAPGGYTCKVKDGSGTMASAHSNKTVVDCAPLVLEGVHTA